MALWLHPFAGWAAGGGVTGPHNVNDAGPPDVKDYNYLADLPGRHPLKLKPDDIRTTKDRERRRREFARTPPGQLVGGNMPPAYEGGAFERTDWRYTLERTELRLIGKVEMSEDLTIKERRERHLRLLSKT